MQTEQITFYPLRKTDKVPCLEGTARRAIIYSGTSPKPEDILSDITDMVLCAYCDGYWTDLLPIIQRKGTREAEQLTYGSFALDCMDLANNLHLTCKSNLEKEFRFNRFVGRTGNLIIGATIGHFIDRAIGGDGSSGWFAGLGATVAYNILTFNQKGYIEMALNNFSIRNETFPFRILQRMYLKRIENIDR